MHTLSQPKIGLLVIVFFLATFCFSCFESTLPLIVTDNFHLNIQTDETSASTVAYLFVFCGLIGAVVQGGAIGRMVKKLGEVKLITISLVLTAVSLAILPFISGTAHLPGAGYSDQRVEPGWPCWERWLCCRWGPAFTRPPLFGLL